MQSPLSPVARDIVLLGGGHAHVQVLKSFAMRPQAGVRLTLISDDRISPYSGMLPGHLAGLYSAQDIHIDLGRLCEFAGARFVQAQASGLDLQAQQIQLLNRPALRYDLLSLNTGAVPTQPHPDAITVKPISKFLPKWHDLVSRIHATAGSDAARSDAARSETGASGSVLIVGGGAGGVEIALAARAVLPEHTRIYLAGRQLMPGHDPRMARFVTARLQGSGIRWVQAEVECGADGSVHLEGESFAQDHVLWVTGVQAPEWYAHSGLATDNLGFVTVNQHLQSVSHGNVFAAGDLADLGPQARAKSGVFAVRAGPVLAENLRRAALERPLRVFKAQARHLALLGCADQTAVASRAGVVLGGPVLGPILWRLKDYIDRRFINNFNGIKFKLNNDLTIPEPFKAELPDAQMRCGGCGAKLAADPLQQVLKRLPVQQASHVTLGMGDDAAQVMNTSSSTLLSVDGFRAMISDPYLFGRIVAHHSLNDLFAMAAVPRAALAFATVPYMAQALMAEELYQVLHGVTDVLGEAGAVLVGGHSAEGAELSVGLTVMGEPAGATLTKAGCVPGDWLVLTKPIGTGTLLAAAMRGETSSESMQAVLAGMDQSNAGLARVFANHANALTDVTGFGLLGHLGEMLRAGSNDFANARANASANEGANDGARGVVIYLAQVPVYPGAPAALQSAPSSLQQANEQALHGYELQDGLLPDDPRVRLLVDPQTSGGLLAAIPPDSLTECLQDLREAGFSGALIGRIGPAHEKLILADKPADD